MTTRWIAPALLFVVLVVGWGFSGIEREGALAKSILSMAINGPRTETQHAVVAAPMTQTTVPGRSETRLELSLDPAALLAEQIALQILTKDANLTLTAEQWSVLAATTSHYQAVRQAYEASIACVAVAEPGHFRLTVPAYPAAGDALRLKLYGELRERLGDAVTQEIAAEMGAALEGHFAGFGLGVQSLDFRAESGARESDYRVTREATFWNGAQGGERLTTRRETHFPGLEDPSGHVWGPLLSIFAARLSEKAGG